MVVRILILKISIDWSNNCQYIKVYYYLQTQFIKIWGCLGVHVCMMVVAENFRFLTYWYLAVALQ